MTDSRRAKLIIAEDESASRALLARHLSNAGYQVIACENGRQALEAIRGEGSCIVVADWMMPEMDGIELCRAVRELCEMQALSFVYFILLTAHAEKQQIVAGLEAGADDYLTKPYHKQELLARLRAGERIYSLQMELIQRQIELHKVNGEFAKLNMRLEELANTDTLTGLANRRQFFDRFEESWALAQRQDQPLGCIMFDIDKFKLINDTHGHPAGDVVLKQVADAARKCLRRYDVLGRIGGEEFCVICPDTSVENTALVAERIRISIAQLDVNFEGREIPVTISLGVAGRSATLDDPQELTKAADELLYRAKSGGRNQVWILDASGTPRRYAEAVSYVG